MSARDHEFELDYIPDDDAYPCCHRAAIVVYRSGLTMTHCYEGTQGIWGEAPMACNESYSMFGEAS